SKFLFTLSCYCKHSLIFLNLPLNPFFPTVPVTDLIDGVCDGSCRTERFRHTEGQR
ncbi:unnamed protein product, partial [Mycena citricolor]